MASEYSDFAANAFLNWLRGDVMPTAPTGLWVALYDGDPTVNGTGGTDVTDDITATGRVEITPTAVTARAFSNSNLIDFGNSLADVEVSHYAVWDDDTAGNCIGATPLALPKTITTGLPVNFQIGDLVIRMV